MAQEKRTHDEFMSDTTAQQAEPQLHTFDDEGDVILVVECPQAPSSKLRVSAKVLSLNSPKLRAQITSIMGEETVNSGAPPEVIMKEEYQHGLRVLCHWLHNDARSLGSNEEMPLFLLEGLILADKYGCKDRVMLVATALSDQWVQSYRTIQGYGPASPQGWFYLLATAYILRSNNSFVLATWNFTLFVPSALHIYTFSTSKYAQHVPQILFARLLQMLDVNYNLHMQRLRIAIVPLYQLGRFDLWSDDDKVELIGIKYSIKSAMQKLLFTNTFGSIRMHFVHFSALVQSLKLWARGAPPTVSRLAQLTTNYSDLEGLIEDARAIAISFPRAAPKAKLRFIKDEIVTDSSAAGWGLDLTSLSSEVIGSWPGPLQPSDRVTVTVARPAFLSASRVN